MRLDLAEPLAWRIQGDGGRLRQRIEIRQPSLGFRNAIGHDHEEATRMSARERSDEHGIGRSEKSGDTAMRAGRRESGGKRPERGQSLEGVEQRGKRHYDTLRAFRRQTSS